jgi:hypothetical protein
VTGEFLAPITLKPMPGAQKATTGNVSRTTPPGHYVHYCECGACAQIIAVDVFAGDSAYTDVLPGLTVIKTEPMQTDMPEDEGRFMAIYLLKIQR